VERLGESSERRRIMPWRWVGRNLLLCRYESDAATRANPCLWRVLPEILLLGAAVPTITERLNVEFETRVAR
jgi:hypothetical protein